ncbi:hypothetical protein [Stenotrophomonas acidaminiphila]
MKKAVLGLAFALSMFATPSFASDTSARDFTRAQALEMRDVQEGIVLFVREVRIENTSKGNAGTVMGGAIGYAVSERGSRNNRNAKRIVGTTVGGVVGNAINNKLTSRKGVEVVIRVLDQRGNSRIVSIVHDDSVNYQVGQSVLVTGRGNKVSVIPL